MDLDTLITEADPARRVPLAGPESAAGIRLYREITARGQAKGSRIRWSRPALVGPVTAALAAAGLAVAVVLAPAGGGPARPAAAPGGPPGLLLAAALVRPPSAATADTGMPPYYVTLDHNNPACQVRVSATGKTTAVVRLPSAIDPKSSLIAAGRSDRTFVLALSFPRQTRFYRLRIALGGHAARLTPLVIPPLPAGMYADGIALSADGSSLAVAIQRETGSPASPGKYATHGAIEVISLATGAVRTWTTRLSGMPANVSWARSGRELAFSWQDDGPGSASARTDKPGLWLLDTAAPGSDLLSGRRLVPASVGNDEVESAVLAPDGTKVIASVSYDGIINVRRGTVVGGIVELSARTGRPQRTLLAERAAHSRDAGWYIGACDLVSADATGQHLLVNCNRFGRLDHGRFTSLPGYQAQSTSPAAW